MTDRHDRLRWATDQPRVGVAGAGSWGTAMADWLARDGPMLRPPNTEPVCVVVPEGLDPLEALPDLTTSVPRDERGPESDQ